MYTIMPESGGNVIGLEAHGKLTAGDYAELIPRLEEAMEKHGQLNILADLTDFSGMEAAAFRADLRFALKHRRDFIRMAVVGGKAWIRWLVSLWRPWMTGDLRCYGPEEADLAWNWVKGEADSKAA